MDRDGQRRRGLPASAWTLAAAVVTAVVALLVVRLPAPGTLDDALPRFSSARAERHIEALATAPRTLGSSAHSRAADYILATMDELGLETEVQETTWLRSNGGRNVAARVRNLLGRLPGDGTDRDTLLLLAHYDTQPQTPGAGDDASGVAVILETLRALAGRPRPNDVLAVVTDGEELGLLGAAAFVGEHPWFDEVDLTLNFEARGNGGPAIMFETSSGVLERVRTFARVAPYPMADSLSAEVYRRMPNDTDFTIVRQAGGQGLNFAMIENLPAYHSRLDEVAAFDRRTLQQEGANALALARQYASHRIPAAEGGEGVYFNPLGVRFLWVYSAATAAVLAAVAVALLAIALWVGSRRGWRTSRLVGGLALPLPAAVLAATVCWLAAEGVELLAPAALFGPHGVPYRHGLATLGYLFLGVASWLACLRLWSATLRELLLGLALLWVALAVATTWLVPGASHLFVWPALLSTAGVLVAEAGEPGGERWWIPAVAVLPAVALWAPTLELSFTSLTVAAAPALAVAVVLASTLLAPAAALVEPPARGRLAALGALVGVVLLVAAVVGSAPTEARPHADSLFLLQEAESGVVTWRSLDQATDPWTAAVLGTAPERRGLPAVLSLDERKVLSAKAETEAIAPPEVVVESDDREPSGRRLKIRLRPRRGTVLRLRARAEVALVRAAIDGRDCVLDDQGELQLSYHGAPPEGIVLEVAMADRWPLQLDVVEAAYGLPSALIGPRPPERIPRPGWWTDTTMAWSRSIL